MSLQPRPRPLSAAPLASAAQLPASGAGGSVAQRWTQLEVPQLLHNRFHERFRWPVDQVLLVSLGMVAIPPPAGGASLMSSIPLSGHQPKAVGELP